MKTNMKISSAKFAGSSTQVTQKPARKLPEFAFIGRSNVGKSSLINMLCGNGKLAMTSGTPGKTRLVNHFLINDSWYLVDLPGYGFAKLPEKERAKLQDVIRDYLNHSQEMVMLFVLIDVRHDIGKIDMDFLNELGDSDIPFAIIFTKGDKLGPVARAAQLERDKEQLGEFWEELPLSFVSSSNSGLGKEEILGYIGSVLEDLKNKDEAEQTNNLKMNTAHKMELFACRASKDFAAKVVDELNKLQPEGEGQIHLGDSEVTVFSDGEFQPSFTESVRGATVFILQSTFPPAENLMELLLTIDAAKRASAYKVIAVMPYFGWARQDRKDKPRVSIGAKLVANLLCAAGVDRIMTCDLHADQIQGFFDIPVDHIYASKVFIPYLKSLKIKDLAIAAPDMGGAKRANAYAKDLACPVIICHKSRERANVVASITAIGEVEGKNVVIVDDMIDTAGTLTKAADILMEKGAKSVRACATHAILSGPAYDRINASKLSEVYVTDTIPLTSNPDVDKSKIKVVSMTETFARIIRKVCDNEPISPEFIF